MVVVAIIGILAALAIPAYSSYLARSRIVEGLYLAMPAKAAIGVVATATPTLADLAQEANDWNAQVGGAGAASKYVDRIQINPANGAITVTYDTANVGVIPAASTLVLTPYLQVGGGVAPQQLAAAIAAGSVGPPDWGCASTTDTVARSRGMPALVLGTLPAQFAPGDCR
jgi:type IV pilus assembly protein PilA